MFVWSRARKLLHKPECGHTNRIPKYNYTSSRSLERAARETIRKCWHCRHKSKRRV